MARKGKYKDIKDRWKHDEKWIYQNPFMIDNFLCYDKVKGTGKNKIVEKFIYDTTNKTVEEMRKEGLEDFVINTYLFLNNGVI